MGVEGLVGPQVDAQVVHMGGSQYVPCGRERDACCRRLHKEAVNQPRWQEETSLTYLSQTKIRIGNKWHCIPAGREIPNPDATVHCRAYEPSAVWTEGLGIR